MSPRPCINAPATKIRPFRGVIWHKSAQKYRVRVYTQGQYIYLGYYDDPERAARVHDVAACMAFGPEAVLNFDGRLPAGLTETEIIQPFARKGLDVAPLLKNWRKRVRR